MLSVRYFSTSAIEQKDGREGCFGFGGCTLREACSYEKHGHDTALIGFSVAACCFHDRARLAFI